MNKVKYHFFGKECFIDNNLSDYLDLERNLKKLNFSYQHHPLFLNQIHSNKVVVIDDMKKLHGKTSLPKADALVTNLKGIVLAIITADCVPILFCDDKSEIIAATHCGWKGAKLGVVSNTILEMVKLGAKPENIRAIIGPAIKQKSYEISKEFYGEFLKETNDNKEFFIDSKKEGHFMFDLIAYVKGKIIQEGVGEVVDESCDTYKNSDRFFSYRRSCHSGEVGCGRNISVVGIGV